MLLRSPAAVGRVAAAVFVVLALASTAKAQSAPAQPRVTLPPVIVTAQKEPTNIGEVPGSVTAVTQQTLTDDGVRIVSEAALFAPNTFFTEFTARKSSNPRFRGIGASPANPAVTTYIDGVPQLNVNSSSVELLDVSQIEFVRGPQSPLYGRNALGGIINITSLRPALTGWTGTVVAPFGNASARELRGSVSGPIHERLVSASHRSPSARRVHDQRDHRARPRFTRSHVRQGAAAVVPAQNWEARVIFAAERDRDGDYALADLDLARSRPFRVQRDFEGYTHRNVTGTTVLLRGDGERFSFTSSTGFVNWNTEDATDLDYSPLPLATRTNTEDDFQFTQEVRVASPPNAPVQWSDAVSMKWQAGTMLFTQNYDQLAVNRSRRSCSRRSWDFRFLSHSPDASLDDLGIGLFGQATLTIHDRLDLTVGGRYDYENKQARLDTYYSPAIAPPISVDDEQGFSDLSPQVAAGYRVQPDLMIYGSVSEGFKAGGLEPRLAGRQRSLCRRARVACRRRREGDIRGRPRGGFRRGVHNRLGRSAAERSQPVRAGPVLHRQRRRSHQSRDRVRGAGPPAFDHAALRQCRLHQRAFRRRHDLERRGRLGQSHPEHAELHGHARRARRGTRSPAPSRCSAGPRRCSTATWNTTMPTRRARTHTCS